MQQSRPQPSLNDWLEEELLQQYHRDPSSVDSSWRKSFESSNGVSSHTNGNQNGTALNGHSSNGHVAVAPAAAPAPVSTPVATPGTTDGELMPLRGAAARIVENMTASLSIPTAASQRVIPMRAVEENRVRINKEREARGAGKVSFTHLIGWAVVRALKANPSINASFAQNAAGEPNRVVKDAINLGIAVDVAGKNGSRSLMVPSIKNAGALTFAQYLDAFDDLVARARTGKLGPADFAGTTLSLTNPGTVGTMSSIPRLMNGQGAIIATGAIGFPPEFRSASPETIKSLGIGKVMSITCAYDHRIIQGAESGAFLGSVEAFLEGQENFYGDIFQSIGSSAAQASVSAPRAAAPLTTSGSTGSAGVTAADAARTAAVIQLIHTYRVRGHLAANLDPLGAPRPSHPELDPAAFGLTPEDLDRQFYAGTLKHALGGRETATLREMLDVLKATYCCAIGCEYMYIQSPEEKSWLEENLESQATARPLSREVKLRLLEKVITAEEFEQFLHKRFIGQKRFSLEGAETTVAILSDLADLSAETGAELMMIGMAHRGRLNVLANVVGKPVGQIFSEFEGNIDPNSIQGSGDVKYHLGATGTHTAPSGKTIQITLAANPSHLEAVDPVVEGFARAKQDLIGKSGCARVLPVLIHGDAAFAGQGIIQETLNLSQLDGYRTGGTVHLVINNQIGFTTLPGASRSTAYATDIARMVQAPILHVNGDDPEACARATDLAFRYRQLFKRDVVIDMLCYRKHGHNEGDDPAYTQPLMYRLIEKHPSVAVLYSQKVAQSNVASDAEVTEVRKKIVAGFNAAFDENKARGKWVLPPHVSEPRPTLAKLSKESLGGLVEGMLRVPATFHAHPKLDSNFLKKRREAFEKDGAIDWAYAEGLAFGSLLESGVPVRLSGQDSGRGTFSQRHLALYDYENGERYIPLQHLSDKQARFDLVDSSLSEYAVLGFEYGYSVACPRTLTLWEGQFGDFANGAQIIIDQFISTAEQKWNQESGLVMLLPHGYEGQGPEHSSGRIERFLTLCAEDNMRVVNCTTPAQYFHLLRRQATSELKPLILFTPKSLLRSPQAVSKFSELVDGSFQEVIGDSSIDLKKARKVVFSAGKVYYDLLAAREAKKADDIALVRLEQIYPFPEAQVSEILKKLPKNVEVVWTQEEPRNMGCWHFTYNRFRDLGYKASYAGRLRSASPATGSAKRHAEEQKALVEAALK